MKFNLTSYRLLALLLLMLVATLPAHASYRDIDASNGKVRVHYSNAAPNQCDVILLGVGTAMSADSYDKLAGQLNSYGYVVAIMDHAPGNMVKTDAGRYRNLALEIKSNLLNWISSSNCNGVAHWIMGGHSAGGQAAHNALSGDPGLANAVFSIDPFDISKSGNVSLPAFYWGFDVTTCFVTKDSAAKAAYYRSTNKRAMVRVKKKYSWGPCGYSPKYFHCSFCDSHCPGCTNCTYTPDHFYVDVAASADRFIQALFYGTWSRSALSGSMTTPTDLFVDQDRP
jgi:hypothetical protein